MTGPDKIAGLSPAVAKVLVEADGLNQREVKQDVKLKLSEMLRKGLISEQDYELANEVLTRDVRKSIAAGNRMDANQQNYNFDDPKLNKILFEHSITIEDLYNVAKQFVGDDNEVSYTHLSRSERQKAHSGEQTSSEIENITNALNDIIKSRSSENLLTTKDTKKLMKALGLDVENAFRAKDIVKAIFVGFAGLAATFSLKTKVKTEVKIIDVYNRENPSQDIVISDDVDHGPMGIAATSVAESAILGNTVSRKEEAYGEQGGAEGGKGSVTNKRETVMHQLKLQAEKAEEE